MMRAALALGVLVLAGCGQVSYHVKPFTDSTGKTVCCDATVTDGQNVQDVDLTVVNKPDGEIDVQFSKKGASASAPIAAATAGVVAVGNAATATAVTVGKFAPP